MKELIKIGTRGSKLALWQAFHVARLLEEKGFSTEVLTIETKGDKILNQPFAEIGSKGIFTEEIEHKLLSKEIDIAVHSAKDMQSVLPEGLELIAFTEREKANDVLVSLNKDFSLNHKEKELIVGTSSARRRAMLKHFFPNVKAVDARGNLQTRIQKMKDGQFEAMILAFAGVHRMEYDDLIVDILPLENFTPAVGQGSIAIEAYVFEEEEKKERIREALNHATTEYCLKAERAYLRTLEGGCSIPIFGHAILNNNQLQLHGGIAHPNGKVILRETVVGNKEESEKLGEDLAQLIIQQGGDKVLEDIKLK